MAYGQQPQGANRDRIHVLESHIEQIYALLKSVNLHVMLLLLNRLTFLATAAQVASVVLRQPLCIQSLQH